MRQTAIAAGLDVPHHGISLVIQALRHADGHSFAIAFDFSPMAQVSPSGRRNPNIMFAWSKRRDLRTLEHFEVQRLTLATLGRDIGNGGFCFATDDQRYAISALFQRRVIIMTVGRGVDLSDFICIAALNANFSALNWA